MTPVLMTRWDAEQGKRVICQHEIEKQYRFIIDTLNSIECVACEQCGFVQGQMVTEPPPIHSGIPWGTNGNDV